MFSPVRLEYMPLWSSWVAPYKTSITNFPKVVTVHRVPRHGQCTVLYTAPILRKSALKLSRNYAVCLSFKSFCCQSFVILNNSRRGTHRFTSMCQILFRHFDSLTTAFWLLWKLTTHYLWKLTFCANIFYSYPEMINCIRWTLASFRIWFHNGIILKSIVVGEDWNLQWWVRKIPMFIIGGPVLWNCRP